MSLQNSGGCDEDIALLENYSGGGKKSKNAVINCEKPRPAEVSDMEKPMINDTCTKERRILQVLLKSGGSENEAAPLREVLMATGWKMEGLPDGWMGRSLPHSGYRLALYFI